MTSSTNAAAAIKQRKHQNQAARIYAQAEALVFAAAAAKKQNDKYNPCAVAAAAAAVYACILVGATAAEQPVEHFFTSSDNYLGKAVWAYNSQYGNKQNCVT